MKMRKSYLLICLGFLDFFSVAAAVFLDSEKRLRKLNAKERSEHEQQHKI